MREVYSTLSGKTFVPPTVRPLRLLSADGRPVSVAESLNLVFKETNDLGSHVYFIPDTITEETPYAANNERLKPPRTLGSGPGHLEMARSETKAEGPNHVHASPDQALNNTSQKVVHNQAQSPFTLQANGSKDGT